MNNQSDLSKITLAILYIIYTFFAVLSCSELNSENNNLILMSSKIILIFFILIITFFHLKFSKFEILLLSISISLGISFDPYLITISFFILTGLAFCYIDKENITYINYTLFISIIFIFSLYYLNILKGVVLIDEGDYSIGDKLSYGFSHPNKASILISQLVLLSFCFKNRFLFLFSLILYFSTIFIFNGRTALGGLLLFYCLYTLRHILPLSISSYIKCIRLSFFVINVTYPILLISFISKGDWYIGDINLNSVTNTRLSLMKELYLNNGGIDFYPKILTGKIVDVGIANLLIGGGWILYIGYVMLCDLYFKREDNINLIILMSSILAMNFMENFINANMLASIILFARAIRFKKQ